MNRSRTVALLLGLLGVVGFAQASAAEVVSTVPQPSQALSLLGPSSEGPGTDWVGHTPPRVSYMTGEVSFWRPGAADWSPAQVNMPLAAGDQLYTAAGATVELQVGGRAFARAAGETQFGLVNQDSGILQLTLNGGAVALDVRELAPGLSIELATPTAALTVSQPGYYLTDVRAEASIIILQRGGQATLTLAGGGVQALGSGQQVVLRGQGTPTLEILPAPPPSDWDRWNFARTDSLVNARSSQYVPLHMYGVADLDRYGSWRVEPEYGPVWIPQAQPAQWAPYGTGRWVWDPYYGWTWVDDAPWGWAPYHYGRWVFLDRVWGWAPGPFFRPVYSPALVAFFGPGGGFFAGGPLGWIALGWGEPIVPWWGPSWFVGRPCWVGWHGPHVVNNVVINKTTVVNVTEINVYRNTRVQNALVAVPHDRFGSRQVASARLPRVDVQQLRPVAQVDVRPTPASFVPVTGTATRPPAVIADRAVVTRRPLPASPSRDIRPPRSAGLVDDAVGDRGRESRPGAPSEQPDPMPRPQERPAVGLDRARGPERDPRGVAPRPQAVPPAPPRPVGGFGGVERSRQVYEPRVPGSVPVAPIPAAGEAPRWSTGRGRIPNPPAVADSPSLPAGQEAPRMPAWREAPRPPAVQHPSPAAQRVMPGQVLAPRAVGPDISGDRPGSPTARGWGGGEVRSPGGAPLAPRPAVPQRLDGGRSWREAPAHSSSFATPTPWAFHRGGATHGIQQAPVSQSTRGQGLSQPGSRGTAGGAAREPRAARPQGGGDRGSRSLRDSR